MITLTINWLALFPTLFLIGFLFNLFVIWIILMFARIKIKKSKLLISTFIYIIVVGITEFILLFVTNFITETIFRDDLLFLPYGIFSFVGIFVIFKMLMPRLMELDKKKVNKYALIMSIVTNPGLVLIVLNFFS